MIVYYFWDNWIVFLFQEFHSSTLMGSDKVCTVCSCRWQFAKIVLLKERLSMTMITCVLLLYIISYNYVQQVFIVY